MRNNFRGAVCVLYISRDRNFKCHGCIRCCRPAAPHDIIVAKSRGERELERCRKVASEKAQKSGSFCDTQACVNGISELDYIG